MNHLVARKDGQWMIVSMTPDMCLTPVGPSMAPVPYPVMAMLSQAKDTSTSVKANGNPLFLFGASSVPQTTGDQPGTGNGIVSGTVGKDCWPIDKSGSVFCEGMAIVRANDKCWMNGNAPCSPLTLAQVAMLERRSRIEAGKRSADPTVRKNAEEAERLQDKIEQGQMLQCADDPSASPPAGWKQTAPGIFEPDATLFEAAGLPAPPPALTHNGSASSTQKQFISDRFAHNAPVTVAGPRSDAACYGIESATQNPAQNQNTASFYSNDRVFPAQKIPPAQPKKSAYRPLLNDGMGTFEVRGLEPDKYDDKAELAAFIEAREAACAQLMPSLPPVPTVTLPCMGNTQGMVVFAPFPAPPAANANPIVEPETEEEDSIGAMDWVHTGLDIAGMCDFFPPLSIIADGVNALISVVEGVVAECQGKDSSEYWTNAAVSGLAMIPGVGIAATAGKMGKTAKKLHKGFTVAQKVTTVASVGISGYDTCSETMEAIDGFQSGDMEKGWQSVVDGAISAVGTGLSAKGGWNATKELMHRRNTPPSLPPPDGGTLPVQAGGAGGGDGGGKPPSDSGDGGKIAKKTPAVPQENVDAYIAEVAELSGEDIAPLSAEDIDAQSPDVVKQKRKEFQSQKAKLIQEWKEKNGKPWPKYGKDVYSNHTKMLRKAGWGYDAHHVQSLKWGGANSADNLVPMHVNTHYDKAGVHAPDSPYGTISDILQNKK